MEAFPIAAPALFLRRNGDRCVACGSCGISAAELLRSEGRNEHGKVVGRLGNIVVLDSEMGGEPPGTAGRRKNQADARKRLIRAILREKVLVAEARRRGLDGSKEVKQKIDAALIDALKKRIARDVEASGVTTVTEEEARQYYDEHIVGRNAAQKRVAVMMAMTSDKKGLERTVGTVSNSAELAVMLSRSGVDARNYGLVTSKSALLSDDMKTAILGDVDPPAVFGPFRCGQVPCCAIVYRSIGRSKREYEEMQPGILSRLRRKKRDDEISKRLRKLVAEDGIEYY